MSYLFDATTERLTGTFNSTYAVNSTPTAFSMSLWIKKSDWLSTSRIFASLQNTSGVQDPSIYLSNNATADRIAAASFATDQRAANYDFTAGTYDSGGNPGPNSDGWVLVVGVWASDADRRVYIDAWANTAQQTSSRSLSASSEVVIGNGSDFGDHADGLIAEVGMWNIELVEADFTNLLTKKPSEVQASNLVGYWPLDQNGGAGIENAGTDAGGNLTATGTTYDLDHPTFAGAADPTTPTIVSGSGATYSGETSSSPNVHAHTAVSTGSNLVLVASVTFEKQATDSSQDITAFTYGGEAMTSIILQDSVPDNVGYLEDTELFYLVDPPTGSNNFSLSLQNDGNDYMIQAVTLQDTHQSAPVGTPVGAYNDNTTAITTNYTNTDADALIISAGHHSAAGSGPFTPATSDGTNVEILDAVVGTTTLGFAAFMNYMLPGTVDTWLVGGTATSNDGTDPGGVVVAVEFFLAASGTTINVPTGPVR